ncbi:MAG: sarcosine oxidase subunit gamma [Pararhodobacter sp.]|nr:sarcosine oxidase subunit gamma [Pararhodobacter sp.]
MSEPVSALPGFQAHGLVDLAEAGPCGMITLRGDLGLPALAAALQRELGAAVPGQRRVVRGQRGAVAWMSPDELLLMVDYAEAPRLTSALEAVFAGAFVTVADVSDARAVFTLTGAQVCDVLAKVCPVDFATFQTDEIRRTRAAQVAAALIRDGDEAFTLICFRSVAQYMADLLATVSAPGGEVGLYAR